MIPEEKITKHLDLLLTGSSAGDGLHHMLLIHAPAHGALSPLGLPDQTRLETSMYALDATFEPGEKPDVEAFLAKAIKAAAVETANMGEVPLFVALSQEMWTVTPPADDLAQTLARRGRLAEHPNAVEVTVVYAACRDGRRWRGSRYLTGPDAGTTEPFEVLVGPPQPGEGHAVTVAPLLRRLVGQR